jgi:hypothetical protein
VSHRALAAALVLAIGAVFALPAPRANGDTTAELRERILHGRPEQYGVVPQGDLWGVVMEVGLKKGAATLVSLVDGKTSLLTSAGRAIQGAEEREEVRVATMRLCERATAPARGALPVKSFKLPGEGQVRFYFLTKTGVRSAGAAEPELAAGHHPLSPLYAAGQEVIAAIRPGASEE